MPDFDVDRYIVERSLFEGPNTKWLPAFSYVRMLEAVGIPLQYSGDTLKDAAEWLNPFVDFLSLTLLVRAGNSRALRKCNFMSRTQIASMDPHLIRNLNNWAMSALNREPFFASNPPFIQSTQESLLESLIEFLSRLSIKLESPDLQLAFRAALKFHNLEEVKTHISLNKSCAPWFNRLFNASSDQLLLEWLPELIRSPLPEEISDMDGEHPRHPAITWPDPMMNFDYNRVGTTQNTDSHLGTEIHEATDWLLQNTKTTSGEARQRALMRLTQVFHTKLMLKEQQERFGDLLWENTTGNGLPDLPNLAMFSLLHLPSPPEVDTKSRLKQHLLSLKPRRSVEIKQNSIRVSLPGEHEDQVIREVSSASKPIIRLPSEPEGEVEWELTEANQLWKDVYEWWENDRHVIQQTNQNPGFAAGFDGYARLTLERISMFLSRVVLPRMETANEEEWNTILSFLSETRQDKIFLTPALPYILLHRPDEYEMVASTVRGDLSSDDEGVVEAAAKAVSHWAYLSNEANRNHVPAEAINVLIARVIFRRPEGVQTCLAQLVNIIAKKPNLFSPDQIHLVVSSLNPWRLATCIPIPENSRDGFPEHERPRLRSLLGQLASALSGWLQENLPDQPEPIEISTLREWCNSDPLPEVRRSFDKS